MVKNLKTHEIRVLVADDDYLLAERLVNFLEQSGFYTRFVRTGSELKEVLSTWTPDFLLIDLMLPELNALHTLRHLKSENLLGEDKVRLLVMSGHNSPENVKECMKQGAVDYLVKPLQYPDVLSRLVLHAQHKRRLRDLSQKDLEKLDEAQFYLHLTNLTLLEALKPLPDDEILYNLTRMVGMAMKAVRVSVVECNGEARMGHVLGSSDLKDTRHLRIDLNKYPEITYVLNSQKFLALDNLAKDPVMAFVTKHSKSIQFNSLVVCPIHKENQIFGVLSVRMPEAKQTLSDFEIRFTQLVAHVAGLVLMRSRSSSQPARASA